MRAGLPSGHVGSDFGYEPERGVRADSVNQREINATAQSMEGLPDFEARLVVARLPATPCLWQRGRGTERTG